MSNELEQLAFHLKNAFEKRALQTVVVSNETQNIRLEYMETVVDWEQVAKSILERERASQSEAR